ncbi:hypothetical protein B0X71_20295 (plasmid) [Planococcus lenghuensis]|uniref:Uncharacterized protein n=1 Tax=Planococcus lenghuensis TaxID=2213202 RepID=A0A1Q2L6G6_9BACL|nr:hypothetical protein B0X71_20295 [Planococcus lenghuensis]
MLLGLEGHEESDGTEANKLFKKTIEKNVGFRGSKQAQREPEQLSLIYIVETHKVYMPTFVLKGEKLNDNTL